MHGEDELGEWEPKSGEWTVHALQNPIRSANPFSFLGRGSDALAVAGKWFWRDYSVSVAAHPLPGSAFGLKFCWNGDESNSDNWNAVLQYDREYLDEQEPMFKVKPDILIRNSKNECIAVADTKYKRLIDKSSINYNIASSDVYQVLAYAEKFDTEKMYLIYPKPTKDWSKNLDFKINNKTLIIKTVDLQSITPKQ